MKHLKRYNEIGNQVFENINNSPQWREVGGKLQKEFEFHNFTQALDFINKISVICEEMNHHPHIDWVWNKITLKLSTHDSGDIIGEKDLELASKIDTIE
jgi:4a-hydroxytetrahydrobiopterin dehydratase